jgi:tetratricopeptide (TPR) repeat protein/tRNA A-37 threonylcarbamoyl transferase component Bud32
MPHTADRNLLLGILALQTDFITRDDLIAAMNAWALEKNRPLEDILVDRSALDPTHRDALRLMVDCHVAKHGGPEASLAALSITTDVVPDLKRAVADSEIQASLVHVGAVQAEATLHDQHPRGDDPTVTMPRYRRVRDHARGGLGVVCVAHDRELHREVALKEIQDKHADDPVSRGRFLLEAEITGGLEHPGIVPVYGLGRYADGRPFYAMRFVKGDSLKDAIARFHAHEKPGRDPGERALSLQKLLRRFLDVCNAIDYAHSRGVLHRDLKPNNIMVGKYGETLVVDWGLAKATGRPVAADEASLPESTLRPSSASGVGETMPGSAIGTPGYMPPEQAAGRLDLLGPASDVYSLGATLYSLLTDRAPFAGPDLPELLRRVEHGEFPWPRSLSPWVAPALEAVCLKAMALRPDDRYPSPRALADDVERWLADEPVTTHREPFTRRARRWARRHRTAVATAAAAILVASALIGTYATARALTRRRVDAEVAKALDLAEARLADARSSESIDPAALAGAAESARPAEALLESGGGPSLRPRAAALLSALADAARDRKTIQELDEARLRHANVKDGHFDIEAKFAAFQTAFRSYGIDVAVMLPEEAAARVRSSSIRRELVAALDEWAGTRLKNVPAGRLSAIATAADLPENAAIRAKIASKDAAALRSLVADEAARLKSKASLRSIFQALSDIDPATSLPLLRDIQREHPSDFWYNHGLAWAYQKATPPRLEEAIRYYTAAVAIRPKSPGVHLNLGNALHDRGDLQGAVAAYREAIRLKPDYAEAHSNLGITLRARGDLAGAEASYREAIRLKPDFAEAHSNLGNSLVARGDLPGAEVACREAIRIRPDLAGAHHNLGVALRARGDLRGAEAAYREAIRLKPDLAEAHTDLGSALRARGDLRGAEASHREAIRLKPDYAIAHYNLGSALSASGDLRGAEASYREAIRLKPDFAEAHYNLGVALSASGDLRGAEASYREAIRLSPTTPRRIAISDTP